MPGWTLVDAHPTQGRTFQRPLSAFEHAMFREGLFNGAIDMSCYLKLRLSNGAQDTHLFSDANIVHAWKSTKRRFPLAGATVVRRDIDSDAEERNGDDSATGITWEPHFVVRECNLSLLGPREIVFGHVADVAEAQQQVTAILDGPRPLSDDLLVQLYIFREKDSEKAREDVLHMIVLMVHCVADEMASRTFLRCLLDTLARGPAPESEPVQMPLEERLAMAIPKEELEPPYLRTLSPARRRWRKAVATVILQMRTARRPEGGYTLPCRLTRSTPFTAARSGLAETLLTPAQTTDVIVKCRQHKITFGNAYLVLAQVAMTRVLYRRYLRGEISEEEWSYRKRQPYNYVGPMNVRPYLDSGWFERGGGGEFVISLGSVHNVLPFMTLGRTDRIHDTKHTFLDGAPPFSDLLTFDRLLHRVGLLKKQAVAFFNHPLLLDIIYALSPIMLQYRLSWTQQKKSIETDDPSGLGDEPLSVTEIPSSLTGHFGSGPGNLDPIFPLEYPLPDTHPLSPHSSIPHPSKAGYVAPSFSASLAPKADVTLGPTIAVECDSSHIHVRSGLISLSSLTLGGQLKMYSWYDRNVFEDEVVKEWVDEVKGAVLWYLGGEGERVGQGVRAKL